MLRAVLVGLFALLSIGQTIRTAAVAALADDQPTAVAQFWPSHPKVLSSFAMAEVGDAAGRGQPPRPRTLQRVEQLAEAEPLYPEPFLVHGALALRAGGYDRAESLLVQARQRDPRSLAARYLLADLYLRTGRMARGVAEISVLSRIIPGAAAPLAPAVAQFARTSGSVAQVRAIFSAYPDLEPSVLSELAEDPRNAGLILALARPGTDTTGAPAWQTKLINNLIEEGDYDQGYSIWAKISGVKKGSGRGLFNPTFRRTEHPPPFNWSFSSTGGGIAEPEPEGGGLHVLYFGREDVVLARQLLLLPTGRYKLAAHFDGELGNGSAIAWTLTCVAGNQLVLDLPLSEMSGRNSITGEFQVPAQDCNAQWLELKAKGQEFPQSADFRISGLSLRRSRR